MAGAATAFAGSTLFSDKKSEMVSECADNSVVGMLQGISQRVSNIEAVLGSVETKSTPVRKNGIDVVLGAQWGDEGKGKLVDMLSQVCFCCCWRIFILTKKERTFTKLSFVCC